MMRRRSVQEITSYLPRRASNVLDCQNGVLQYVPSGTGVPSAKIKDLLIIVLTLPVHERSTDRCLPLEACENLAFFLKLAGAVVETAHN